MVPKQLKRGHQYRVIVLYSAVQKYGIFHMEVNVKKCSILLQQSRKALWMKCEAADSSAGESVEKIAERDNNLIRLQKIFHVRRLYAGSFRIPLENIMNVDRFMFSGRQEWRWSVHVWLPAGMTLIGSCVAAGRSSSVTSFLARLLTWLTLDTN